MPVTPIKTRFAPSPSGFLHLGNARVALFCALMAKSRQGVFILRIEDTDQQRSAERYVQALQEDLLWLGLGWQEGPGVGGGHGPYAQSQRATIYRDYFDKLSHSGQAYPCFCSEQELALMRKTQLASGRAPRYAGTCTTLSSSQIDAKLEQGLQPTLRFRVVNGQTVQFNDLVRGPQRFASDDIGDFIIRRADGTPAFFFSNAIDDALMCVTHVLRGEDHLSNTPRQIMLLNALSLATPEYGHVSLILGADGTPLAKRHGSHSVRELHEAGYFPEAVNNYLARLGHYYENNALMDFDALATGFELTKIGRAPARFDNSQLQHWQHEVIAHASLSDLWDWIGPEVHALLPAHQRDSFLEAVRPNIAFPKDALRWARILFTEDSLQLNADTQAVIYKANRPDFNYFAKAVEILDKYPEHFMIIDQVIKRETGLKGPALFHPLRVALTGELNGPEFARLLPLLGAERAHKRLEAASKINNYL